MRQLLGAILLWLLALPAHAQDQATLVADRVYLSGDDTLTAEGAVEVFYRGARLTAEKIVYDQPTDQLTITGPIRLTEGGGMIVLADAAELSRDLQEGILTSARLVLDQQLQLAATEMARISGRYTRMSRVVASSCQVCPGNPTPLWEVRARRVIHDQQERQLYFDHAQFRVAGVPVFYLPRLRMPDPTLKRATGFLLPSIRTTSSLGPGIKLPYFIAMGDSRDLTLTPYVSSSRTRTLEFRYRQAFRKGELEMKGAVSRDDILMNETRGYLFGEGSFDLPRDFQLDFWVQGVSDDAYILDYGLGDIDRLASGVRVTRTRRNEHIEASVFRYWSLRAGDDNAVLPNLVGDFSFQRRFKPRYLGGEGKFAFEVHSQERRSAISTDANGDGVTDGRDVSRATAMVDWRRNWVLGNGILVSGAAQATADFYAVSQDVTFPGTITRFTPAAAVELRWPWVRSAPTGGASHVIEPVVQLVVSPDSTETVPNEDSQIVSFDEGNLFGFNRFSGADRHELGTRINMGLSWTRHDPAGWSLGITAGRVFRKNDLGQFGSASGLDGTSSDWLVAAQIETADGLRVINRAIFDDGFDFSRDELRVDYLTDRYTLAASYLWLTADPAEGRLSPSSEVVFDAGWSITPRWRGTVAGRYDFDADRAARASVGLEYRNECAAIDLSLSRRFTSSTSVSADTDFNLSVELLGFGSTTDGRMYRRSCVR
ncbi:LPS-assembly protein LptD [Albidovulum aquaemixtae]|nr:LPS assembly protein LptD [Defluviimonas aquaemixtae]